MKKLGRNDPCSCGSGKKFKKCCESQMLGGRFRATPIGKASRISNLTSLFQGRAQGIPPKGAQGEALLSFSALKQEGSQGAPKTAEFSDAKIAGS